MITSTPEDPPRKRGRKPFTPEQKAVVSRAKKAQWAAKKRAAATSMEEATPPIPSPVNGEAYSGSPNFEAVHGAITEAYDGIEEQLRTLFRQHDIEEAVMDLLSQQRRLEEARSALLNGSTTT